MDLCGEILRDAVAARAIDCSEYLNAYGMREVEPPASFAISRALGWPGPKKGDRVRRQKPEKGSE